MNDIIQSQLDRLESRQIAAERTISELRAAVKVLGNEVRVWRVGRLGRFDLMDMSEEAWTYHNARIVTDANTIAREAVKGDGT